MIKTNKYFDYEIIIECDCCGKKRLFEVQSNEQPREVEREIMRNNGYIFTREQKTYCCKRCYNIAKNKKNIAKSH